MVPDTHERLLNNVVRSIRIAHLKESLAEQDRLITLEEVTERLLVGFSQAANTLIICELFGHDLSQTFCSFEEVGSRYSPTG